MEIQIESSLKTKLTHVKLGCILCNVAFKEKHEQLSDEMDKEATRIASEVKIEEITKIDNIFHTREAYKILGKKPSRYRPSAEALHRRIVRGLGFYKLNNIVDVTNLISLKTGFSIGTYDTRKIEPQIYATIGQEDESYEGIRKEPINIHNLPVLADVNGKFGNPCSDSQRAMIDQKTKSILMVLWSFSANDDLEDALETSSKLFENYCSANNLKTFIVK